VHGGGIKQNDPAIAYTVKTLLSVSPKKSGILYFPVRTKSNARNNWALFTPSNSVNLKPNGLINLNNTFRLHRDDFHKADIFSAFLISMNALFICSRNQWRSPTAEAVFRRYPNVQTRSAGTSPNARHTVSINDITWSDKVFVMEQKHKNRLSAQFSRALQHKEIIILDIPDDYRYMDEELIEILKESVEPYLSDS